MEDEHITKMTRHELFLEDSYLKELETEITDITDKGIKCEQTIFYPRGGGQPEDKGIVVKEGISFKIKGINKTNQGVYLVVDDPASFEVGDKIVQKIDWEYRYRLMQHHTILHILSAVVWDKFDAKVTGGTIYQNKARLDFDLDTLNDTMAQKMVDEVNSIISQHHSIEISFVDRETAEADPDLIRTKINLLPDFVKEIRLVRIGDVDLQADGGLHVNNTSEINEVELIKTENKGKGRKRISIGMKV